MARFSFSASYHCRALPFWAVAGLVLITGCPDKPAVDAEDDGTGSTSSQSEGVWRRRALPDEKYSGEPGRWRRYRTNRFNEDLSSEQRRQIDDLEAIGYVGGSVEAGEETGVTVYEQKAASSGLNFYSSGHAPEAILMDMEGTVLHRWKRSFSEIWPDYPLPSNRIRTTFWRRAHLFENGDILVIFDGLGLAKLDRNSKVLWSNPRKYHHDLQVMPNGDIYVLSREARINVSVNPDNPILEDYVSILDRQGNEKRLVSILRCFQNSKFDSMWPDGWKKVRDIFHTNTIQVLDGAIADRVPAFKRGNVLICLRAVSTIAVLDLEKETVVWAHTGTYGFPHESKVVEGGNMILFDNLGGSESVDGPFWSRALEYEPSKMEIVWEYRGSSKNPFFSRTCGTVDRLPNGNTLVTESDNGRAFELTPEKRIVWEFFNPNRAGAEEEFIATLFEVVRLRPDFPIGWARGAKSNSP
ncbi:MAG: hypothetical protein GXP29_00090 [Planctomycetes bacterium]|nr:hypothetical protein [Planctomycetota bacterium]